MCEILLMIKTDGTTIKKSELERFLNRCVVAGASNRDGYGVMCENWYMKSINQIQKHDIAHILSEYKDDSRFFAVHVRFATCEKKEEYTHPFVNERFMLMHNGVLSVDNEKSGSDSLDFFNAMNSALKNSYVKAIKEVTKKTSGSFSILSYVYSDDALYYFRNTPSFDFMLCEEQNIIYGATDIDRLKPLQKKLYGFFETAHESRPLKEVIYKIDLKSGTFERCGYIEEKPITAYKSFYQNSLSTGAGTDDKTKGSGTYNSESYGGYE